MRKIQHFSMHDVKIDVIPLFIFGATILALIYHAVLFFFNRDRFLIHYLIYLGCTAIFLYTKTGLIEFFYGERNGLYFMHYFKEAIQIIYLTSYFNFIVEAIGISRKGSPFLFRYWAFTMTILIGYSALNVLSRFFMEINDYSIPFISIRIFIFAITGIMLYQSYKLREIRFQSIILFGSTIYMIFGLLSFYTNTLHTAGLFIQPMEYMMIGTFIDILFFSFAIGYRNKKEWESLNLTLLEEANKFIELQKVILEKQTELENERTRIAADMHDDLGSGLTKITYLSQMALKSDMEDNLLKIKKTASELVGNMSELIWVMKEENNTLEDLATYIKSYAVDYLENNNIGLTIQIPEAFHNIVITGNDRRNLFLSVKECLHNIVKHAEANHVTLTIAVDDYIRISIHDNGIGIDINKPKNPFGGNGIRNIKKRIDSMKGELILNSDSGTHVLFMIPLTENAQKSTVCTIV